MRWLAIIVLCCLPGWAQVLQLSAGQSTLLDSAGGGITAYLPNSTATIGAGTVDGHLAFGFSDAFPWRGNQITAGDSGFGYSIGNAGGVGIQSRGITITRQQQNHSMAAFAGLTGVGYSLPFFSALKASHAGAGFYYQQHTSHLQFAGLAAFSGNEKTLGISASTNWKAFSISGAGGLLANQKTATGQFTFQPGRYFNAALVRQELYWQGQRATVNSASAFSTLGRFNLHATAIDSHSNHHITAQSGGIGVRFGFASFNSDLYQTNGQRLWIETAQENTRHWNFTESFSTTGALHSFGAGAGYHGNRFAISFGHSVQFLPFSGGYTNVSQISISFKLWDTNISAAASKLPTGTRYTVGGNTFIDGPLELQTAQRRATHRGPSRGRFSVRGSVIDKSGMAVSDAAVALNGTMYYTNAAGEFVAFYRDQKPVQVAVAVDAFSAPGNWHVISTPQWATPGEQPEQIVIVVSQ